MNLFQIASSNHRARVAIASVRVLGRDGGTMAEVHDGLAQRRRMRSVYNHKPTAREIDARYQFQYLLENAPDIYRKKLIEAH